MAATAVNERIDPGGLELTEKVVYINRVAKVVKGGRRFSFTAVVVVGDGKGHVGAGVGRAREVPEAIRKGVMIAKRNLIRVPMSGSTITHEYLSVFGAAKVMMKPASPGTGVIAGGGVRAVVELAGIRDILTKSLGSNNPVNVVKATLNGLASLRVPEEVFALRGIERRTNGRPADQAAAPPAGESEDAPAPAVAGEVETPPAGESEDAPAPAVAEQAETVAEQAETPPAESETPPEAAAATTEDAE